MSWENFPINVWHQCNVKIHFGVVGVCWSNRQDGKSNKSHCWSWMRLRSMMVRTVDISLMLFIIHHPTIWVRFPRTGILLKMWHFFLKSRAFVWPNLIRYIWFFNWFWSIVSCSLWRNFWKFLEIFLESHAASLF